MAGAAELSPLRKAPEASGGFSKALIMNRKDPDGTDAGSRVQCCGAIDESERCFLLRDVQNINADGCCGVLGWIGGECALLPVALRCPISSLVVEPQVQLKKPARVWTMNVRMMTITSHVSYP